MRNMRWKTTAILLIAMFMVSTLAFASACYVEPEPEPTKKSKPGMTRLGPGLEPWNYWMIPHKLIVVFLDGASQDAYYPVHVSVMNGSTTLFNMTYWAFPKHNYIAIYLPESLFPDSYQVTARTDLGPLPFLVASRYGIEINAM